MCFTVKVPVSHYNTSMYLITVLLMGSPFVGKKSKLSTTYTRAGYACVCVCVW